MRTESLRRVGAVCAVAGALLTGVFNGMHPELAEPAGIVKNATGSSNWSAVHWGLIVGMVLMQIGFLALARTLRGPAQQRAGDWAALGVHMLILGLSLWISVFAAEAALKPLADAARAEHTENGALALASLVDAVATAATFVYWLGVALLGVALLLSELYPRWLGAIGVAVGAAISLSFGLTKAFLGASAWTERYGFQTLAILFLAWTLALGAVLWRESDEHAERRTGAE